LPGKEYRPAELVAQASGVAASALPALTGHQTVALPANADGLRLFAVDLTLGF
jgi:hypothetical protein